MDMIQDKKRKQNFACDACRSSHLSCLGSQSVQGELSPCQRCAGRSIPCTYRFSTRRKNGNTLHDQFKPYTVHQRAPSQVDSTTQTDVEEPPESMLDTLMRECFEEQQSPASNLENTQLYKMYTVICEGALSIWLDAGCSPLLAPSISTDNPFAHNFLPTVRHLDRNLVTPPAINQLIEETIHAALQAFASRWIYKENAAASNLSKDLWLRTQSKLHMAMAIPSHRTFFALMLFSWTPIPKDCEDSNNFEPRRCTELAFRQFHYLHPKIEELTTSDLHVTSFYWFSIVFETVSSVVARKLSTIPIDDLVVWNVIDERGDSYLDRLADIPISHQWVVQVCRAAAACKIHAWWLINRVQGVAFEGQNDATVFAMIEKTDIKLRKFQCVYSDYLFRCEGMYASLSPFAQMSWVYLKAHHLAGILFYAEALDELKRRQILMARSTTQMWLEASLDLARIAELVVQTPLSPQFVKKTHLPENSNVFHLDPRPQYIVEPLLMAGRALMLLSSQGALPQEQAISGAKSCLAALGSLSQAMDARKAHEVLARTIQIRQDAQRKAEYPDEHRDHWDTHAGSRLDISDIEVFTKDAPVDNHSYDPIGDNDSFLESDAATYDGKLVPIEDSVFSVYKSLFYDDPVSMDIGLSNQVSTAVA